MDVLDTLLRGAASAIFALLALKFALSTPRTFRTYAAAALNAAMLAYVLESSQVFSLTCGPVCAAISITPVLNPALLWFVGVAYFDDEFRPRLWHAALIIPLIAPLFAEQLGPARFAFVIGLYIHLAWTAFRTGPEDLVAARIKARKWFFAAVACIGLTITAFEIVYREAAAPEALLLLQALVLVAITGAFALLSLTLDAEWTAPPPAPKPVAAPPPADAPLLARLQAAMAEEVWRTEGLTIGALAKRLQTPEHRLRAVINQNLGYRNFTVFINEQRIEAAKQALSDPAQADQQVLTIAYDVGFASLGPFNRAFKAATGDSPTEFRRKALANS